jgi:peptidoglycan/xylan/chitin deacetylase (PgdA/CDA1 family)
MAIVSKKCTVVSFDDIVRGDLPRNSYRTIVAVTFDDGYLDNYENAVPILLRHKIPGAFFISTGIVGTTKGFAHDIAKLGKALPNMSWEQIKHMKQLGFTIGSHTVNHVNCAKDDAEKVKQEIVESKQTLENKLGLKEEVIFAYPFGKKEDMNKEILEFVRETGYVGCTSAYGGHNGNEFDPFNILRGGIDSNFSILAFKSRLEGF